ncbi:GDSL-type esterase/lipase family protein [Streptomyces fulvoviolaceus]|uniref:GDSL-type esterase/lipase family protein n=1 Tax=Streptomyces fulvoviolaceus TaxID=285535 RepID=UPI00131DC4EA
MRRQHLRLRRRYGRLPHAGRRRPACLPHPGRVRAAGRDPDRQWGSAGRLGRLRLELRRFQGGFGPPCRRDRGEPGTNDAAFGSAEFRTAYRAYLEKLRAAAPHARILALRPFDGTHAADIAAVVGELADPRTEFVDTTGWLDAAEGDFHGTVHPSAQGHRKAADRLISLISKESKER